DELDQDAARLGLRLDVPVLELLRDPLRESPLRNVVHEHGGGLRARLAEVLILLDRLADEREHGVRLPCGQICGDGFGVRRLPSVHIADDDETPTAAEEAERV